MKKSRVIFILIALLLISFVAYTFISTGFFREVNNSEDYEVIATLPLSGAEDFTISYDDDFMLISQDDRGAFKDNRKRTGNLYYLSLKEDLLSPVQLQSTIPLYPHGISLLKIDSARYQLLVVNHYDQHTIERFELIGDSLIHLQTFTHETIVSPNDVVALDEHKFYFTNDHGFNSKLGLLAENYLGLAVSNVIFYDGNAFREVASGISYANGITISKDRRQVLVASPRKFLLKYYDIEQSGDLRFAKDLAVGTGIDNIELDENGDLWIGAHPSLLRFSAYAAGKKPTAPSEVIKISNGTLVESVYTNDGTLVSASTVATPYNDLLFIGTVMDDKLLVLKKKGE